MLSVSLSSNKNPPPLCLLKENTSVIYFDPITLNAYEKFKLLIGKMVKEKNK